MYVYEKQRISSQTVRGTGRVCILRKTFSSVAKVTNFSLI